jgi:hypothetical protein
MWERCPSLVLVWKAGVGDVVDNKQEVLMSVFLSNYLEECIQDVRMSRCLDVVGEVFYGCFFFLVCVV